jgi:peptidoglycan hydrolase CwlO-like protein
MRQTALALTRWIGSPQSVAVHTVAFVASFGVVTLGVLSFDRMLLVLTTLVSLEAIYLSLFIQMTVNYQAASLEEVEQDIDEIQEDIDEIQEDVGELAEEIVEEEQQNLTLEQIHQGLQKLIQDVERLQQKP